MTASSHSQHVMRKDVLAVFDAVPEPHPTYVTALREFSSRLAMLFDVGADTGTGFADNWNGYVQTVDAALETPLKGLGVLFRFCHQRLKAYESTGSSTGMKAESTRAAQQRRQQDQLEQLIKNLSNVASGLPDASAAGGSGASATPALSVAASNEIKGALHSAHGMLEQLDRSGGGRTYGGVDAGLIEQAMGVMKQTMRLSSPSTSATSPRKPQSKVAATASGEFSSESPTAKLLQAAVAAAATESLVPVTAPRRTSPRGGRGQVAVPRKLATVVAQAMVLDRPAPPFKSPFAMRQLYQPHEPPAAPPLTSRPRRSPERRRGGGPAPYMLDHAFEHEARSLQERLEAARLYVESTNDAELSKWPAS